MREKGGSLCIQTAEQRLEPGAKAWRLCPGEGLGLLNHLVDEVICFRPFEGLSGTDSGPQSEGQPHAAFSGFKMSMSSHHHIGTLP